MGSISIELKAEERGGLEVFWKKFKKRKQKVLTMKSHHATILKHSTKQGM